MEKETYLNKEVGYKFTTKEVAITDKDLDLIYDFLGPREHFFVHDDYAQSLELKYQKRIVAGIFLLLLVVKLDISVGMTFDAILCGMNDIKFISAAYPGDRLRLDGELLSKKTTSKGHILIEWQWILKNQNDTIIATGKHTELFPKASIY